MKLPPFDYHRAESVEDALAALAEAGDEAKLLAGGQSLLAAMAFRLVRPALLIDIGSLPGLDTVETRGGALHIGALVRHASLERAHLTGAWALLGEAAVLVGHLPIRVRGTLGGSIAHADPAAELAAAALALDAEVIARSHAGERCLPATGFFLGPYTTALGPDEMIVGLRLPPPPPRAAAAFEEFAARAGDFALASACAVVVRGDGRVESARIALGGVGATPLRAAEAEALLEGSAGNTESVAAAARAAAAECDPVSDMHADARYRRELVEVMTRRALTRALAAT